MHSATTLPQLLAVIRERQQNPTTRSYTATLLAGGVDALGAKVLEEAHELVEAAASAGSGGRDHFLHEAADLVYHLLVLLRWADVEWEEVEAELGRRMGISGLEEKAARSAPPQPPRELPQGPAP